MPETSSRQSSRIAEVERVVQAVRETTAGHGSEIKSLAADMKVLTSTVQAIVKRDEDREVRAAADRASTQEMLRGIIGSIDSLKKSHETQAKESKESQAEQERRHGEAINAIENRRENGWKQWAQLFGWGLVVLVALAKFYDWSIRNDDNRLQGQITTNASSISEAKSEITRQISSEGDKMRGFIRDTLEPVKTDITNLRDDLSDESRSLRAFVGESLEPIRTQLAAMTKAHDDEVAERKELERRHEALSEKVVDGLADGRAKWEATKMMIDFVGKLAERDRQWWVREMDRDDIEDDRTLTRLQHHLESLIYDMSPSQE